MAGYQKGYSRWGVRFAEDAARERKKHRRQVAKRKRVAAHKRRVAGKVVHVRSYCRRRSSRRREAMPF